MGQRLVWIVFDSLGVGSLPDATEFGDEGANTLLSVAGAVPDFACPNLERLGLGRLGRFPGISDHGDGLLAGSYGRCAERAMGKDTITGHWEMAGIEVTKPFHTFTTHGFPKAFMDRFERESGHGWMCNFAASGTQIINEYGEEHRRTGKLIVYTSGDSVFQIAAHEQTVPLGELYRVCAVARGICDDYGVARVIARPFVGEANGTFTRTYNRRDYAVAPPHHSVLDHLIEAGIPVHGVGKIADIFNNQGISTKVKTKGNRDGMAKTLEALHDPSSRLIYTNLVDFDSEYGHRRNAEGYARAMMEADDDLSGIMTAMKQDDLMLITADHGNDPCWPGSDHTREYIPVLAYSPSSRFRPGTDLGTRTSFADQGRTVADFFGVKPTRIGESFLGEVFAA